MIYVSQNGYYEDNGFYFFLISDNNSKELETFVSQAEIELKMIIDNSDLHISYTHLTNQERLEAIVCGARVAGHDQMVKILNDQILGKEGK